MYRNVMEMLVETKVNDMWKTHDGCTCEQCREDVIAYALNRLPPQYVSSSSGELFTKVRYFESKHEFEITKQIAIALKVISATPHHRD